MNTTNYNLELLISGITAFLWIFFLFLTLSGPKNILPDIEITPGYSLLIIFIIAPFCYILGTICDRISELLIDTLLPNSMRADNRRKHRTLIYLKSERLTDLYEYGKLRVRVCRNWVLNGTLLLLVTPFYMHSEASYIDSTPQQLYITVFIDTILLLSVVGAFVSIKELKRKEAAFLELQGPMLKDTVNRE